MRDPIKSVEVDTIRIAMLQRGWSSADVAKRAGFKTRSFEAQMSTGFPNTLGRLKVEAAFDYFLPVWSTTKTLAVRKFCRDKFGADPSLLSLPELRQLAARISFPGWQAHTQKTDLLAALIIHLAVIAKQT